MKNKPLKPDSEDSLAPERTIEVLQRLLEIQESRTGESEIVRRDREINLHVNPRERISDPETSRETCARSIRTARRKKSETKVRLAGSVHVQYYYFHRA